MKVGWWAWQQVVRLEAQGQNSGAGACDASLRYAAGGDKMTPAVETGRGEKTGR